MRLFRYGAIVLLLSFLVSCGIRVTPPGRPSDSPAVAVSGASTPIMVAQAGASDQHGYVGSFTDAVEFIQWTERQGNLAGQAQLVYITPDKPLQSQSKNLSFTGVRSGSNVSLTVSEGLGTYLTWTGTLKDDTLTLVSPDSNGQLITSSLHVGTVNDYNAALATFRQRLSNQTADVQALRIEATRQAQAAQSRAARQKAVSDANDTLAGKLANLASAKKTVASDTNFSSVLAAYAHDWKTMQADYGKETTDAGKTPLTCYQLGTVKYDRGTVHYDLGSIQYDDGSLKYVATTITNDSANISSGMGDVETAYANLKAAAAANETRSPSPRFSADDVSSAISAARQQTASSASALSDAQSQGTTFDQQAAQLDQTASAFANSLQCQG